MISKAQQARSSARKAETAYQRIKRAAVNGHGCQLTAEECQCMYNTDTALKARADLDDEKQNDHLPNKS